MKQLIDTALDKGFEDLIVDIFRDDDGYLRRLKDYEKTAILTLIQKWLREERSIHVSPNLEINCGYSVKIYKDDDIRLYLEKIVYHTYEEALEQGLQKALTLL